MKDIQLPSPENPPGQLLMTLGCAWLAVFFFSGVTGPAAEGVLSPVKNNLTWTNAPWSDPAFFPLAVWLQEPANAERYRKAGFNTYVGLWKGPTEEQLAALKKAGLCVICEQNEVAFRHRDDPAIIGWMHGDEPDNAQELGLGLGYGPPVPPEKIIAAYQRIRTADPSRPVMLNLGQGVAWDGWYGRGKRTNHPEDYPDYLKGCDIASFDIYPVNHDRKEVSGKLWLVANGVQRLLNWCGTNKIVWNCLECTAIDNPKRKPTPRQVRCEAWMSLIHGSRGLIFFVHQFKPAFREAALLDDPVMLAAVSALNRQITELAPVLNSPTAPETVTVQSENPDVPVDAMVKQYGDSAYLFAVGMCNGATMTTFTLKGIEDGKTVEVIGEGRSLAIKAGSFNDTFGPWDVHLYRLKSEAIH
jgi:hypothetical protein